MSGNGGSRTPDAGGIYDALLCGKDNFAEDREAARQLIAAIPRCRGRGAGEPGVPRPRRPVPGRRSGHAAVHRYRRGLAGGRVLVGCCLWLERARLLACDGGGPGELRLVDRGVLLPGDGREEAVSRLTLTLHARRRLASVITAAAGLPRGQRLCPDLAGSGHHGGCCHA